MQSLESYRNYILNSSYFYGILGYNLSNQLDIGGCNLSKLKKDLKVAEACIDFISCYDYPFNFEVEFDYLAGENKVKCTSDLTSLYVTNFTGVSIAGTGIPDNTIIIGADLNTNYLYLSNTTTISSTENLTLVNIRTNCNTSSEFTKISNLLNKILGTNYCIDVEPNYLLSSITVPVGGCVYGSTTIAGKVYPTIIINDGITTTEWLAANLDAAVLGYEEYTSGTHNVYGYLYTYDDAQLLSSTLGLTGWRLPSYAHIQALQTYVSNNGGHLKSTSLLWLPANVGADNTTCFSALPGGRIVAKTFAREKIGEYAYWWTTDRVNPSTGYMYNVNKNNITFDLSGLSMGYYLSVRLMRTI